MKNASSKKNNKQLPPSLLQTGIFLALVGAGIVSAHASCTLPGTTITCSGMANPLAPAYANSNNNLTVTVNPGASVGVLLGLGGTAMSLTGSNDTLINNGTIDPSLLGLLSIPSNGTVIGNASAGTISVTNTGTMKGTSGLSIPGVTGMALTVQNGTGGLSTINNTGTIASSPLLGTPPIGADAAVVAVYGGGRVNFINSGTITGRVAFEASATPGTGNAFLNVGLINGSVSLGANSANTFTALTGSSVSAAGGTALETTIAAGAGTLTFAAAGMVDGGAGGNNTLNLQQGAPASGTIAVNNYLNFNHLQVGSGTWTINGASTVQDAALAGGTAIVGHNLSLGTGTITASGGTLQAGTVGLNLTNNVVLAGSGLAVGGSTGLTLSGVISGSGALTSDVAGTLTLTGINTYAGSTTINNGSTLALASGASLGSGAVVFNGGKLQTLSSANLAQGFNLAGNGTFDNGGFSDTLSGGVHGTGSLTFSGAGTTTLIGANTYTGSTTVSSGTLIMAGSNSGNGQVNIGNGATLLVDGAAGSLGSGAVTNDGSLIFNQPNSVTVANAISGTGSLTQAGTGTLTLTGASSYVGSATVNAGTLNVDGSLASKAVNVNSGGTLDGTGTIAGNVVVNSGGTAAASTPGAGLTMGSLTLHNGSTYRVAANAVGQSGKLTVTGSTGIGAAGTTLSVMAQAGSWLPSTTYTVLHSGNLTGTFANVTSNFAYLVPTVSYTATDVNLTLNLQQQGLNLTGASTNQTGVSAALDHMLQAGGNRLTTTLAAASTSEVARALPNMVGEQATASVASARTRTGQTSSQIVDRMAGMRLAQTMGMQLADGLDGVQLAQAGSGGLGLGLQDISSITDGLWVSADYTHRRDDADKALGSHAVGTDTSALAVGYDRALSQSARVGVALSADHSNSNFHGIDASIKSDGIMAMLYGNYQQPGNPVYLSGMLGYGKWNNDSKRSVVLGSLSGTPHGKYDTTSAIAYAETGINLGINPALVLQPYAGIKVGNYKQDAFTETGGNLFDLSYGGNSDTVTSSVMGIRYLISDRKAAGKRLDLQADMQWQHNFGSTETVMNTAFASSPEYVYQVYGTPMGRNSIRAAGSMKWYTGKNMYLYGQLNAQSATDSHSVGASFGSVWKW